MYMNIFLCDDDPVYLQALYDGVSAYMAEHHLPYAITSCTDPAQALSTRSLHPQPVRHSISGHSDR